MKQKALVRAAALGLLFLFPLLLCPGRARAEGPGVSAAACVLMDAESGTVLYEKNADESLPIASITKLMTALVTAETCSLEEPVEICAEWTATEGTSMGLTAGETCTVRELLYGLLLASGNDAGVALACHAAGDIKTFAARMNERAAKLGMTQSHFANPHGLDEEGHFASARDMARLACAVLENRELALIVSTEEARLPSGRTLVNHNKLLRLCPGCVGLKTGYTSRAGRTLVSACERNGTCLVCVTLNDGNDWEDHTALYDWGFDVFRTVTAASPGEEIASLPVLSGTQPTVALTPGAEVRLGLRAGEELTRRLSLPPFAFAPVRQGERAGSLWLCVNGEVRAEVPLVCAGDVPLDESVPLRFWERVRWALALTNEIPRTWGAGG